MLPLRLAVFAAVSALALWGLFSLLDTLREPQLLRSPETAIVKGCEQLDSTQAAHLCPQLRCQQRLLQDKSVPWRASFTITVDKLSGDERLIGGRARTGGRGDLAFACVAYDNKIEAAAVLDQTALETLAGQPGDWAL